MGRELKEESYVEAARDDAEIRKSEPSLLANIVVCFLSPVFRVKPYNHRVFGLLRLNQLSLANSQHWPST